MVNNDLSQFPDKELKAKVQEWSESMFTHTKDGKADINSIMLHTP